MLTKTCKVCGKEFSVCPYRKNTAKYCSRQCSGKSRIGIPLSITHKEKIRQAHKGKLPKHHFEKGHKHSKVTKRKIGKKQKGRKHHSQEGFQKGHKGSVGEKNFMWKSNEVGYVALHDWVRKHKGKPKICEHCNISYKERKLHWANKSGKYLRDLADWISLCVPCHKKYDRQ